MSEAYAGDALARVASDAVRGKQTVQADGQTQDYGLDEALSLWIDA